MSFSVQYDRTMDLISVKGPIAFTSDFNSDGEVFLTGRDAEKLMNALKQALDDCFGVK